MALYLTTYKKGGCKRPINISGISSRSEGSQVLERVYDKFSHILAMLHNLEENDKTVILLTTKISSTIQKFKNLNSNKTSAMFT